jgi:hypothetical protein
VVVVLLLLAAPAHAQRDQPLRVVPLVRGDQVLVSFELTDGVTEELREAIQSGLRTTLTYTVELRLDVPAWIDRTLDVTTVTTSVQYDNLTRQHGVSLSMDGREVEASVMKDDEAVRIWMTRLVRLPLFSTTQLAPNREYYVRVTASARPSNGSILWPFGSGPSAQAKFTFIR